MISSNDRVVGHPYHQRCCVHQALAYTLRHLDFLPSLSFGDCFYKTVKPDRKNVPTGVNISIMPCATLSTSPFSYSKSCSTFRNIAVNLTATRTSLGSVSFIHDFKTATCVFAFVSQLSFHFKPTCIVNRFG